MIENGKFEVDSDGDGMSDQWRFSGDSGVVASWERDQGFDGEYSQKLICTRFTNTSPASHAMLCQMDTIQLEKGKWYKIAFAAKQEGIRGKTIQLAISNTKVWSNCGLQEAFRATPQWKKFEFTFQATQSISDNVRLQLWYNSTGTFWLDSVSLEPSQPIIKKYTDVLPPTNAKNLIPNSSFECGKVGWGSIADLPGWGGNLNALVGEIDTETAKFGKSSLKIALSKENIPVYYFDYYPLYREPVKAPLLANHGWISVEPGTEYTLSAYMKFEIPSEQKIMAATLSIQQAFRGPLRKQIQLTEEWDRYTFTFKPQSDQIFVAVGMDLGKSNLESGTVWIDGIQLERDSQATEYCPHTLVEVGIESDQLGNLFPYGVDPEMTALISNSDDNQHSVKLHLQTTDFDDAVVNKDTVQIDVPPQKTVKVPVKLGIKQMGFYRLNIRAEQNNNLIKSESIRFAIVQPHGSSDSLFGMNHAYPWKHLLNLSKQIGLCWFRDWSLKWNDVEKEKGKFDFSETDYQIGRVLENGLNVLPLLPFPSSSWSSSASPDVGADRYPDNRERVAYMPRDMEEFAVYVRTTVENYRDRLNVWEILNEPIYTDYALPRAKGYSVEDYVKILEVAYKAVKEADPNALVIGGIAGGPNLYTREFIEAGGLNWVDALNLHTYPGLTAPESYDIGMRELRERMRSAGAHKSIWFTEGAYYADDDKPYEPYIGQWLKPVDSEAEAAEWQIKFNTILLAYGAKKIIYHSGTPGSINNESLSGIFFEWAGAPRKMLATQSAMANILSENIRSFGRLDAPKDMFAYGFEADEKTIIVAWAEEYTKIEIPLADKSWSAVDLQGNKLENTEIILADRPVYFISNVAEITRLPWQK